VQKSTVLMECKNKTFE